MASCEAIELRVGNIISFRSSIWRVVSTEHVKPGKGGAFMQVELSEIKNGTKLNERFRSEEKVERLDNEDRKVEFMYESNDTFYFMIEDTSEEIGIHASTLGKSTKMLTDNMVCTAEFVDNNLISIRLPDTAVYEVVETAVPTSRASFKPAKLSSGVSVNVPDFIEIGDEIIIKTQSLEYKGKAK